MGNDNLHEGRYSSIEPNQTSDKHGSGDAQNNTRVAADKILTDTYFKPGDPVYELRGGWINAEIAGVFRKYPYLEEHLNGAHLLHGSKSASLLAFTDYCERSACLLAIGLLEKWGKVPFCGEIYYGRSSINKNNISTLGVWTKEPWARYASNSPGWTPNKGKDTIKFLTKKLTEKLYEFEKIATKDMIEIEEKRLKEWPKLTTMEQALVMEGFPALYGICPNKESKIYDVNTGISGEMLMVGGVPPEQISVILVPRRYIPEVKSIISKSDGSGILMRCLEDAFSES